MLKMPGIKFEKISNIDKYLFIEKGLREEFLILLKDMRKQIINPQKIAILKNLQRL